jgi:hypothetical protein
VNRWTQGRAADRINHPKGNLYARWIFRSSSNIELLLVCVPALANPGHDRLVLWITPQAIVVLVSFELGGIHISIDSGSECKGLVTTVTISTRSDGEIIEPCVKGD